MQRPDWEPGRRSKGGAVLLGPLGDMTALCGLIRHFRDMGQVEWNVVGVTCGSAEAKVPSPAPLLPSRSPPAPQLLFSP